MTIRALLPILVACGGPAGQTPTDGGPTTTAPCGPGFADVDGDGFGDPAAPLPDGCDEDEGFARRGTDCDDLDPTVHPGAFDAPCDGLDDDCDGAVEEGVAFAELDPHDTLQAAIDAVADGGTVWVCPIEHAGPVVVPAGKALILQGTPGATLTSTGISLDVAPGADVTIDGVDFERGSPPLRIRDAEVRLTSSRLHLGTDGPAAGCIDAAYTASARLELSAVTLDRCEGVTAGGLHVDVQGGDVEVALTDTTMAPVQGRVGGLLLDVAAGATASLTTERLVVRDGVGVQAGGVAVVGEGASTVSMQATAFTDSNASQGPGGVTLGPAVASATLYQAVFSGLRGEQGAGAMKVEGGTAVVMEKGRVVSTEASDTADAAVALGPGATLTSEGVDWGSGLEENETPDVVTADGSVFSWTGTASFVCSGNSCE